GPTGFVARNQVLPYLITFSNKPVATAPAQVVVITEQLDPNLDFSTFQLGNVGFGSVTVNVPAGRTNYSTRLDMLSAFGLFVDIRAIFNVLTGVATWTFTSIDPVTLDLPSNRFAGFLPPDVNPPQGDGFVTYTVRARSSSVTGTRINAQATIIFD